MNQPTNGQEATVACPTHAKKKSLRYLELFDNRDFCRMLDISLRTAVRWRKRGMVSYVQVGRKIYYKKGDIEKLLNIDPEKDSGKDQD